MAGSAAAPAARCRNRRRFMTFLSLGLEQRGQWLAGIRKLARSDRDAALDQPARDGNIALRIDADRISEMAAVELEQQRRAGADCPAHAGAGLHDLPAHALDVHVVLLGPERRGDVVRDVAARGIAADDRAMLQGLAPI